MVFKNIQIFRECIGPRDIKIRTLGRARIKDRAHYTYTDQYGPAQHKPASCMTSHTLPPQTSNISESFEKSTVVKAQLLERAT